MDQRNLVSSLVFLLLSVLVLTASAGLGIGSLSDPQTGFMPALAGALLLVFSLILFYRAARDRSTSVRLSSLWQIRCWKSLSAMGLLLVYLLLLPWVGYLIATAMLMGALFFLNSMTLRTSALAAILATSASYGLFDLILKTPLPRGPWGF
jgi:hypothetical protein